MFHSERRPQGWHVPARVWLQTKSLAGILQWRRRDRPFPEGAVAMFDMRFREFGIETDCFPVLCNRSIQVAFGFHHKNLSGVRLGVARIHTECGAGILLMAPSRSFLAMSASPFTTCAVLVSLRLAGDENSQEESPKPLRPISQARHEGRLYNTHVAIIKAVGNEQPIHPKIVCCLRISLDPDAIGGQYGT